MAFYSKFFKPPVKSVLGIDIGSSAIKIVQITKKNGQAVLETYGELALGPYAAGSIGQAVVLPPDKLAQALVDLMKEKEVGVTTRACGISIPFASSLMSVLEIPQVSAKQLKVMVPLEARKYIPVPISEVMLDWSIIPKDELKAEDVPEGTPEEKPSEGKAASLPMMDILVVAIHNDTLARYQEIVTKAALDPGFFEIEIFSTMRAVLEQTLSPVMIMDMGAASTKLYIVERGVVKASHTVNRGSQEITITISQSLGIPLDQAEVKKRQIGASGEDPVLKNVISLSLDYILAEANRTILSFEKKYNKTISQVILVGGGSALKGLVPIAKESFKTETIAGNPFSKLSTPAFLEKILAETGPEFAVAVGLALRRLAELE